MTTNRGNERPGGAPALRSAGIAALCCSLLVLLLPSLLVFASVDTPSRPDELSRLQRIVERRSDEPRIDTSGSRMFHSAAIPEASWPVAEKAQQALLVHARLMQVLGVLAMTFLVYLVVLLASGRLQALLACGLLAALPPIRDAGYILRPETVATLFALLSLLLFQAAARPAPRFRYRSPRRSLMMGGGLMLCGSMAAGMACEAMPSVGATLLVPGVVLMAGSVQLGNRGIRCLRRRSLIGTPIRALNRRLIPWTATALIAPAITWWLLISSYSVSVHDLAVTERGSSLLPESAAGHAVAIALLVVGLAAFVLRVGIRFGRGSRIGPDLILLVYCAVFLITYVTGHASVDPLPMLPATAIVMSEGVGALMVLGLGLLARRRTAVATAARAE